MKEDYILVLFERHKYVLWESLKKKSKKKNVKIVVLFRAQV